ncbi:MAG: hypothetical protein QHH09_01405 [Microgenomates group bacterium]|nr:hypothetical protein [Microgenomates group bacterium]
MDFKKLSAEIIASLIIVLRRFIFLIFTPYKTLRKISLEKDWSQILIIFFMVYLYFNFAYLLRESIFSPNLIFIIFLINFFFTCLFFYIISRFFNKETSFDSFVFSLTYSLFPTLVWFFGNSLFYFILPPPRRLTLGGKIFSIFFIAFSVSLLIWKLILFFLSIRFSSRLGFYKVFYFILLYLCFLIPLSILFYYLKIFRIPFI